jgi:acyl-coenzyme A synthetase/AMP-(fatty) acid ligase
MLLEPRLYLTLIVRDVLDSASERVISSLRTVDYDSTIVPEALRRFHVNVPMDFNWGFDVVDNFAREGNSVALIYSDDEGVLEKYTFSDMRFRSNQLANFMSAKGIGYGDSVLVMLPNIPTVWELFIALIKIGAPIIPSATLLTEHDLEHRIRVARAKAIITTPDNTEKFAKLELSEVKLKAFVNNYSKRTSAGIPATDWEDLAQAYSGSSDLHRNGKTRANDPALIYFTSGTVGLPKIAVHTHASYPLGHSVTGLWLGLKREYLHWNISSPGWAKHGWSSVFAPWSIGACTFAFNYRGKFEPSEHLRKIGEFHIDSICAAPTIWRMFILQDLSKFDLSSLKEASSAGEPLNPEVIDRFRKVTGLTIKDGYGQTESVVMIANFPKMKTKPGSMGIPSPLYDVEIVDDKGQILPNNEEGNVAIRIESDRPFALIKEYAGDPQRNAEAFKNGWYYTGDRAYKDEEGYFWFVGRADDVFKSSAYRIGPFEVESALIKHKAVAETAVVASPDEIRGSIVKAFVVLKAGYVPSQDLANELATFVANETAPFKHPRKIEFVETLDSVKTISGKIRRKELRDIEQSLSERKIRGKEFQTAISKQLE